MKPAPICSHQVFKKASGHAVPAPMTQRRAVVGKATQEATTVANSGDYHFVFEELGPCRRRVTVTVPASICQSTFAKTVNMLRKDVVVNLQGFRPEKIPLSMIVQQVGGQKNFKSAVIEALFEAVQDVLIQRLELGPPVVPESERIILDMQETVRTFDPAKPFTYSMEYEVAPPVVWKSSYRDIEVTLQETGDFSTDEAAAAALVREHLKSKAHQNVCLDRGLQAGDVCICDMDIRKPGAKEPLPGLKKERLSLDTEVDPLGLVAGMGGMRVGETRTFGITMPDDHPVEEWRGMACTATMQLRELLTWKLPKFDDAFVVKHFPEYESAVGMTQALIAATTTKRMEERDSQLQERVREAVVACLDMGVVPDALVQQYGDREYKARLMVELFERKSTLEELEKRATPEMIEEFIENKREELEGLVRFSLAVDDVAAAEGLEPEEKDVESVFKIKMKQYQDEKLDYDPDTLRNEVNETIRQAKVLEWLKDNVKTKTLPYVPSATKERHPYPQPASLL